MAARATMLKRIKPFLFIVAAFVALRLVDMLTSIEVFSWSEELMRGSIAHAFLTGLRAPLMDYMPDGYSLGALVEAALALPFFKIFGPSLFALKFAPLLISTATLILMCVLLARHFSVRVALVAGVTYVLAPPAYSRLTLLAMGFHSDSVLFSVVILLAFYELMYRPRGREALWAFAFGAAAGVGVSYAYITALTVPPCLIAWRLQRKSTFNARLVGLFAVGLIVGLAPMLAHNLLTRFEGVGVMATFFRTGSSIMGETAWHRALGFPVKLVKVVLATIPSSACFTSLSIISSRVLCCVYGVFCLLVLTPYYAPLIRKGDLLSVQQRSLPILLYFAVFIVVYTISDYPAVTGRGANPLEFRYLCPFWFFAIMALAIAGGSLKKPPRALVVGYVGILAMGAIGHARLLFMTPFGHSLSYRGFSTIQTGDSWGQRLLLRMPREEQFKQLLALTQSLPAPEATYACWTALTDFESLGLLYGGRAFSPDALAGFPEPCRIQALESWGLFLGSSKPGGLDELRATLGRLPPEDRKRAEAGVAVGFAARFFQGPPFDVSAFLRATRGQPELQRPFFRKWGLATDLVTYDNFNWPKLKLIREFTQPLDARQRAWVWHGVGEEVATSDFSFGQTSPLLEETLREVPPENLLDFAEGMGFQFRNLLVEDRLRAYDWIDSLPHPLVAAARAGAADFEAQYRLYERQ